MRDFKVIRVLAFAFVLGGLGFGGVVSALTYQQEIGVNFTFNEALRLTLSAADIHIYNLAPGTVSDSNIINVNVATNSVSGYTLTATVGNNTTYNTRNLVHSNTSLSDNFASIDYTSSPTITSNTNLDTDKWAFSFSTDNGTNWSNYNGLPLYSDTNNVAVLKESNGPAATEAGDIIKFKIAAKASANKPSGDYNNVINFNLAAKVLPQYTVVFNANDGSGTMPNQTIFRDEATMLAPNSFTPPTGKIFGGWNTAANGSGTSYTDQQSVTNLAADGATITLYAQWDSNACNGHETELYCLVAAMSKGTQTAADLQAVITKPTSSNPTTDTSNSGVYEYNSSVFGTASDASNTYPIYYYRGILDSNLDDTSSSSYGSNGDGAYYPNYVKLGNTCWRIVRTTGSGGVKMIYNGFYSSGTTANSCANAQSNAQITTRAFGSQGASAQSTWYNNISRVGYTYNAAVDDSTTTTSVDTVFGNNSNYTTTNTTDSYIKDYIENTWFTSANGISAYESILEPSAGYCNDRTAFSDNAGSTALTTIPPYATSSDYMYFGSYSRNYYAGGKLSLTCPSSRNTVDLYTTASATNGNKQLAKPVALLTSDEVALSGSGASGRTAATNYSSNYSYSSFLRSGSTFWLLSPRSCTGGIAYEFVLHSVGYLNSYGVGSANGVRPAISLTSGTTPSSGSGTATDPWVVAAP